MIDSHCHVNFGAFRDDAEEVIARAIDSGVRLVNVGTNLATSKRSVELAEKIGDGMVATIGVHPIHLAKDITETARFDGEKYAFTTKAEQFDKREFFTLAQHSKVVAIGESGLDYYHLEDFRAEGMTADEYIELQKETLYEILGFGREVGKPHVFHCRDAYDDFVDIVRDFNDNSDGGSGPDGEVKGVMHCFTGTVEQAQKILDLGLYIGFTGIITFPSAGDLRTVVENVPLERILLETDSPYLAPQNVRGQRNEPQYVRAVAEQVAEIKGVSIEEVEAQTEANTIAALNIEEWK